MGDSNNSIRIHPLGEIVHFDYSAGQSFAEYDEVFVWDLDKTYLDTRWQSFSDLMNTSFGETSHRKNVPGTATLVRSLKSEWMEKNPGRDFPIFFITASPPQVEKKIRRKLISDDILPLGIFFKDNLKNLWPGRFSKLSQHVGFKVGALMHLRGLLKENVSQVFWGDDSETDAVIYSIYSDICSDRLSPELQKKVFKRFSVTEESEYRIREVKERLGASDPVEKIYINLALDTDPEYYLKFGRRMVPTYSSFQIALDLFQDSRLSYAGLEKVAEDLIQNYKVTVEELQGFLDGMVRRKVIAKDTLVRIVPELQEKSIIYDDYVPSVEPSKVKSSIGERVFELEGHHEPWVPDVIDYLNEYR